MRLLLAALILPLLAPAAAASDDATVGILPAEVQPIPLLRGDAYLFRLEVQNGHAYPLEADLSTRGDAAAWATLPAPRILVPARGAAAVEVAVTVPEDAQATVHEILVVARFDPASAPAGSGFRIAPAVGARLLLPVTGDETRDLRFVSLSVADVEEGQAAIARLGFENAGNVRERAGGVLTVSRVADGATVATVAVPSTDLPPLRATSVEVPLPELPYGQFLVRVAAANAERADEFKVLPPGALSKDAQLLALEHPAWLGRGDVVRVEGIAVNTGAAVIARAVLLVEVWRDGRLVAQLTSEPARVAPGEEARLPVYFTPDAGGVYSMRAILTYDGWRTQEAESILNVDAPPAGFPGWAIPAAAVAAGLVGIAYVLGRGRRRA